MDPRDQRIAELEAELVAKDLIIAELEAKVAKLTELVTTLMERLGQNSSNSHMPPSSDGPAGRSGSVGPSKKDAKKSKRKRGGQPGHKGHRRKLLPAENVDHFVDLFAEQCESCWASLPETQDPDARRYQVTEVPAIEPETTELRRHAVTCSCGHTTRAPYKDIPLSPFGPRLMSLIALFTGVYHLSRRQTVSALADVLGVHLSLGALSAVEKRVSDALETPWKDAWTSVNAAPVKHTDATSWIQGGKLRSLWTIASESSTVFKIFPDGCTKTIRTFFGSLTGILVSDRATVFNFWAMNRRQICWAHLLRKFISFSERDGPAAQFGKDLLDYTEVLFNNWHAYRDGKLDKKTFHTRMKPLRAQIEECLQRAVDAQVRHLSGSCSDMLAHKNALWTFVDRQGVEPTNNHAERELRAFVLWRKRSFGSQSDTGNVFAARIMTVAHTARKQRMNVLVFLTDCCTAWAQATTSPSLFAAQPA